VNINHVNSAIFYLFLIPRTYHPISHKFNAWNAFVLQNLVVGVKISNKNASHDVFFLRKRAEQKFMQSAPRQFSEWQKGFCIVALLYTLWLRESKTFKVAPRTHPSARSGLVFWASAPKLSCDLHFNCCCHSKEIIATLSHSVCADAYY